MPVHQNRPAVDSLRRAQEARLLATSSTTLPLFATSLGALGLFGWRRKRKKAAAIAA